jgi:lysozyme
MRVNDAGLDIIKRFEGLVDGDPSSPGYSPYRCPANIPTIGYGATRYSDGTPVSMGDRGITEEEAENLLAAHCDHAEYWVSRLTQVAVTANQFSALVSLIYNIGSGNFQASTVRQKLNRRDYDGAADNFWQWRRGGGRILSGLVRRRAAEAALFRA